MIIRATTEDVSAIQSVAEITWPHTFAEILTPEQIRYMLDWMYNTDVLTKTILSPGHDFWLFVEEGQPLGFAGVEHQYQCRKATKLHKIYVLPTAQGKRVGQQLLEHVLLEAQKSGSEILLLNVNG